MGVGEKCCTGCRLIKPTADFYRNTRSGTLRAQCKQCCRERRAARVASGYCGDCHNRALPGGTRCETHTRRTAAAVQRRYASRRGRAMILLTGARNRARAEGVTCTLDLDWFESRLAGVCEMTGLPFDFAPSGTGHFNPYAPSVDRKLSRDYTPDNCRVVLTAMNWAMNTWGEPVLRNIMDAWLSRAEKS